MLIILQIYVETLYVATDNMLKNKLSQNDLSLFALLYMHPMIKSVDDCIRISEQTC